MTESGSARIFISYSRTDGAKFAADLRQRLLSEDLSVWQDIVALEGGRDWWTQIEDALRSKALQHFILVVTPAALERPIVRREIRLARQEGKMVSPVKGPGVGDLAKLPRWLGQVYDLDLTENVTTFIRVLQGPSTQNRVAMMAPDPPTDFVPRPAEFDALKQQLLDPKGDSIAITAALRGAGGYGKTTLAKALAHDADIQDAYFDGILWVELGEKRGNLLSATSDLVEILSGERPGLENINAAAAKLGEALGDRRILVIVDDAWREEDLRPFLQGGPDATRLITTRRDDILPSNTVRQPVDAMQDREALALLAAGLPQEQASRVRAELGKLAARLGEWALLLKLVNGFLRDRVTRKQKLTEAISGVNERLDEKGLTAFDARNEADRTKAVTRTIGVSLDLLDDAGRARFGELAVFPEDADVPIGIVARLWAETGSLDAFDTEDFLSELFGLSLLLGLRFETRTVRLHDTVRHFLHDQAGKPGLIAQHEALVRAITTIRGSNNADAVTQRYYYLWLPYHIAAAGDRERLNALLLDPGWLAAKLATTGNPQTLVADYEQHGAGETQNFIGRTLRLTVGICARDPRQLMPQLLGRLMRCQSSGMLSFLHAARRQIAGPALVTQRWSLTSPGAESGRIQGHSDAVTALCLLPDGRLASASNDHTIRVWELETGAESACLEGHSGWIAALCLLPDGRLASASHDGTIGLWDVKTGAQCARLKGHFDWVTALCLVPDGRLASGSSDDTIGLWDLKRGEVSARLKTPSGEVTPLCPLPDGRLASGSWYNIIQLWDVTTGAEIARFEGHSGRVTALSLLQDGRRFVSGSEDQTIRLWDVETGAECGRLEGHSGWVSALCVLPDGRLASGSADRTIRLWDVETGVESARLEGHSDGVTALCVLPDGRLASGSADRTIRLWNVEGATDGAAAEGHSGPVRALCLLPGGRLASGSFDSTIRLWDVKTGAESACLEGHSRAIAALCLLPDGRLASASHDGTIRLWDAEIGIESAHLENRSHIPFADPVTALYPMPGGRLASAFWDETILIWNVKKGAAGAPLVSYTATTRQWHPDLVTPLCVLPDGRLAAGYQDNVIRLWDVKASAESAWLEGHAGGIRALCLLPDGRLASGSYDRTIRFWDVKTRAEKARLEGHADGVCALCLMADGQLASASYDHTIRLWDIGARREITRLEVDAPVYCLAALPDRRLAAGDQLGRVHWLEIVE